MLLEVKGQPVGVVSLSPVGPREWVQVIWFGGKSLYFVSPLASVFRHFGPLNPFICF